MKNNPQQLYTLLQSIEGVVWEADASMKQFIFISDQLLTVLGYPPESWLSRPKLWELAIHPDDTGIISAYHQLSGSGLKNQTFKYRMLRADGQIVWIKDNVTVVHRQNESPQLCGIMSDETIVERLNAVEHLERDVLKLNSDIAVSLHEILLRYLQGMEAMFPQMLCSIHRIKNGRLADVISPSLPVNYIDAILGIPIGENNGSCGAAAALKQQVIVSDIATDSKWTGYKQIALQHGLRACWSNPVFGTDGDVIATLAMYYHEPKWPGDEEMRIMERSAALLQIILENREKAERISEANMLMLQSQEMAHFGNWRWDIQQDVVSWSPALYAIYGVKPDEFDATFIGYQNLLHPDDRLRVYQLISGVIQTKKDVQFEERIIRPDGTLRYLQSWAKLKCDAQGQPVEMVGACIDVTEKISNTKAIEQQNNQLREIAWLQSHIIRAPLVRIMGLINLLKNAADNEPEKGEMLDYLIASANELDEMIHDICRKTESAFTASNSLS